MKRTAQFTPKSVTRLGRPDGTIPLHRFFENLAMQVKGEVPLMIPSWGPN